jgi:hypothetical protein
MNKTNYFPSFKPNGNKKTEIAFVIFQNKKNDRKASSNISRLANWKPTDSVFKIWFFNPVSA